MDPHKFICFSIATRPHSPRAYCYCIGFSIFNGRLLLKNYEPICELVVVTNNQHDLAKMENKFNVNHEQCRLILIYDTK